VYCEKYTIHTTHDSILKRVYQLRYGARTKNRLLRLAVLGCVASSNSKLYGPPSCVGSSVAVSVRRAHPP